MSPPADPIVAVTHPDPYPYYADLVARRPLHRDEALGLWVACGAEAVTAVLTSEICRVRPAAEPVPRALEGSPAGEIFGRLVRMNDLPRHRPLKLAVAAGLDALAGPVVLEQGSRWARTLAAEIGPATAPDRVTTFAFGLSVHVIGSLLGIAEDALADAVGWTEAFSRCLAPGASPAVVERGRVAAGHLLALGRTLATAATGSAPGGLLPTLARFTGGLGRSDPDVVAANAVGLLSQAYEATAGLIGNTLLALARHPEAREAVAAEPGRLRAVVAETLRHDAPIQNTRRFVAADGTVAGQPMAAGDAVLVVLAAANRDPSANDDPHRFDLARKLPRLFTFGAGMHACPGQALATTIATAGVESLLAAGVNVETLPGALTYRPSANARIPLFGVAG